MKLSGNDNPADSGEDLDKVFDRLAREQGPRMVGIARAIVCRRCSPEDVVQQALMNLYQHRERYDWSDPTPLLRRAVVNEALRQLRRKPMLSIDSVAEIQKDNSPATPVLQAEMVEQVKKAIDRLPDHFKAALVLCEYERMSYPEIAQTLGITIQQTKTWIFRGRRQLEKMLGGYVECGKPVQ